MTAVGVDGLWVHYDGTAVLEGVELTVGDGELFFLLGPSGCGKTTLLRTVAGFVDPSAGRITFDGRPMHGVPAARRDCGMVFQNYALWPHLTVAQNVAFGLDVRKVPKPEKARRVAEALRLVQMEDYAERPPNRLSGGQQQRVALARALVVEPKVLLLDEPLSNLDAALRIELRAEIRDIQRRTGRTALYVTHDRAEALALADRIAVLRAGRIEQVGTPHELYETPASPFVAGFVGDANRLTGRRVPDVGGKARVEGGFGSLDGRWLGDGRAADGAALVLLRPERLRLLAGAGAAAPGRLAGVVRERTFLGETLQHDVELEDGTLVRVLSLGAAAAYEPGTAVTVHVDDALIFPGAERGRGSREP